MTEIKKEDRELVSGMIQADEHCNSWGVAYELAAQLREAKEALGKEQDERAKAYETNCEIFDALRAENEEMKANAEALRKGVVELRKAINCEVDLANKPMLSEAYYVTTAHLVTKDNANALDGREGGK